MSLQPHHGPALWVFLALFALFTHRFMHVFNQLPARTSQPQLGEVAHSGVE